MKSTHYMKFGVVAAFAGAALLGANGHGVAFAQSGVHALTTDANAKILRSPVVLEAAESPVLPEAVLNPVVVVTGIEPLEGETSSIYIGAADPQPMMRADSSSLDR